MEKLKMNETVPELTVADQLTVSLVDDLMFEELEQRIVPISGACATSSSCSCSSSSCVVIA